MKADRGFTAGSVAASAGALFSAAACCVLPLGLAAAGMGTGALAAVVPFHWPLTILAAILVAAGWLFHWRRRRACATDAACAAAPPDRARIVMLGLATLFVGLSAIWPGILEQPLMRLLGGA